MEIAAHKTEVVEFDLCALLPRKSKAAQYLGFILDESGPGIRESSLARQWRKMRRMVKRTKKVARIKIGAGLSKKAHTKKLRRQFTYIKLYDGNILRPLRNFSSYGRRSAIAFGGDEKISTQLKRLERAVQRELTALKALGGPTIKTPPTLPP